MYEETHRDPREPVPEIPRVEPEIIPPPRADARTSRGERVWVFVGRSGGTRRLTVAAPSPLSIILALLIAGLIAAVVLLLLLGLVVVWVPIIAAVIAAFVLSVRVRGFWRRLRSR